MAVEGAGEVRYFWDLGEEFPTVDNVMIMDYIYGPSSVSRYINFERNSPGFGRVFQQKGT